MSDEEKEYTMVEHEDAGANAIAAADDSNNENAVANEEETTTATDAAAVEETSAGTSDIPAVVEASEVYAAESGEVNASVDVDAVLESTTTEVVSQQEETTTVVEAVAATATEEQTQIRRPSVRASITSAFNNAFRRDSVKSQSSQIASTPTERRTSTAVPQAIAHVDDVVDVEIAHEAEIGSMSVDADAPIVDVDAAITGTAHRESVIGFNQAMRRPTGTTITEREMKAAEATYQLKNVKKQIDTKHFVANGQQLTLKRKQERELENLLLKEHFSSWITELTDIPVSSETFCDDLYDGVALCRMMAKVTDVPKFTDPVDRKKMFEMHKLSNLTVFIRAAKKIGVRVLPGAEKLTDDIMIPCLLQVVAFAKKAWEVQLPNAIAKRIEDSEYVTAEYVGGRETSVSVSSVTVEDVAATQTPPPPELPPVQEERRVSVVSERRPSAVAANDRRTSIASQAKESAEPVRKQSIPTPAPRKVSAAAPTIASKKVSFTDNTSDSKPRSHSKSGKQNGQGCLNLIILLLILLLLWMLLFSSSNDDRNRRYQKRKMKS